MESQSTYLKKLQFDPKLERSIIAKYFANPRLAILVVSLVISLGVISFLNLPRVLNPEIKIPIVLITTVLPGAGPSDVESLMTVPLESAVSGLSNVKRVQSSSRDSVSLISLEFESGVDPEKARTDVQSAVDGVNDLPNDAQTPKVVKLDFENQPVWIFDVMSQGDTASLIRFSKVLRDKLEELSSIERVETTGLENQEIQVIIKPEVITTYHYNPLLLSQAIKVALGSYPAGTVHTSQSSFTLSIDPVVTTIDDIRNLMISLENKAVPLSDIADIYQHSKPDQSEAYYATASTPPQRVITFTVFRSGTISYDVAAAEVEEEVNKTLEQYNGQFSTVTVVNFAEMIDDQFNDLAHDFWLTIALIFASLFIFLGTRQAVVASLATPLSFLITFIVMRVTNITISFISLFSLLLALGLLIDDTIVVISAMTSYYRTGKFTPQQTALLVWRDFFVAILTTTITTVWAFLPLLLSTGIIGEFIKPIPIVVSSALMASLFVALFITLPFIIIILKPNIPPRVILMIRILVILAALLIFLALVPKTWILALLLIPFTLFVYITYRVRLALTTKIKNATTIESRNPQTQKLLDVLNHGLISFERLSNQYRNVIKRILMSRSARKKAVLMVIIFSLFSYALLPLGFVKNEFFPKSDSDYVYLNLEMPSGTNLTTTKNEALRILQELKNVPEVKYITLDLGRTSGGFDVSAGNNLASFTMLLNPKKDRNATSMEIAQSLRERFQTYHQGKLAVVEESGGPPAGSDLQIKLFGDDLMVLDQYANKIQDFLKTQPGVTNIDKSIKSGTSKIAFEPDNRMLTEYSLSQDSVGFWLRLFASGFPVDSLKLDGENIDITVKLHSETAVPENIGQIVIPGPRGDMPIASLGKLQLKTNPTLITREDGKRTLSVTAGVTPGFSVSTLNSQLENFANNNLALPTGYTWKTGGVNEENQQSVNSILQAMGLSFLLILITMVVQFSSFRRALIVLLVIPLSIAGVFIIFALTSTPLSFPALIGVLALFGIVVKNSILIVDKIVQNHNAGLEYIDSIVDGAASRLEAIALTSMTAIIGLIPITLSNELWRGLGGAIIAGLTFSGTIMLVFIPVVYYFWFKPKEAKA